MNYLNTGNWAKYLFPAGMLILEFCDIIYFISNHHPHVILSIMLRKFFLIDLNIAMYFFSLLFQCLVIFLAKLSNDEFLSERIRVLWMFLF